MTDFLLGELVYAGTSNVNTATSIGTVNYRNNGAFEIINIQGEMFSNGMIIYGDDSNANTILTGFDLSTRVESGSPWDTEFYLVNDQGGIIVEDDFFTGKRSQDYQKKDIIVALNIPEGTPEPPVVQDFTFNTDNIVVADGEYVVLPSWIDAGSNTSNSAIYDYLVKSELE